MDDQPSTPSQEQPYTSSQDQSPTRSKYCLECNKYYIKMTYKKTKVKQRLYCNCTFQQDRFSFHPQQCSVLSSRRISQFCTASHGDSQSWSTGPLVVHLKFLVVHRESLLCAVKFAELHRKKLYRQIKTDSMFFWKAKFVCSWKRIMSVGEDLTELFFQEALALAAKISEVSVVINVRILSLCIVDY